MEERRSGCSIAAETPPPLLGLVAFAVLPPLGCCSATVGLLFRHQGARREYPVSPVQRPQAELDRYLEASKIRERAFDRINNVIGTYNDLMLRILFPEEFEHFDDFTIASSWERFISKIEAICHLWMADGPNNLLVCFASSVVLDAPEASRLLSAVAIAMSNSLRDYGGFNRNHSSEVSSPVVGYLPGYIDYHVGMRPQIPVERKWALGLQINSNEYIWWKANARETKEELINRGPKFLD
ncbi:hypothetical protein Ahy_A04g020270 [Arachis hypogaea]|uniref:Uncharacterized protein n=1 Tax=Arachis hypogaea TaxID=3818 RepID=A0A445DHC3_ARAHY|nr:hypothetical protein Ahy_A04g020270 [Arachis hypogaea]